MNLSDDIRDTTLNDAFPAVQHPPPQFHQDARQTIDPQPTELSASLVKWTGDSVAAQTQPRSPRLGVVPGELETVRQPIEFQTVGRSQDDSLRKEFLQNYAPERLGNFASPLSPLRERDLAALAQWFQRDDMFLVEADVNQMLLHLLPEPCWDEDAFAFLSEFL